MSGVSVDDKCINAMKDMQLKKIKCRFIQMKIENKKTVVIEKQAEDCSYDDFLAQLPEDEGRYVIFDYNVPCRADGTGGGPTLIFIAWVPDTAKVHAKMIYASSLESVKQKLKGWAKFIQASGKDDIEEDCIKAEFH